MKCVLEVTTALIALAGTAVAQRPFQGIMSSVRGSKFRVLDEGKPSKGPPPKAPKGAPESKSKSPPSKGPPESKSKIPSSKGPPASKSKSPASKGPPTSKSKSPASKGPSEPKSKVSKEAKSPADSDGGESGSVSAQSCPDTTFRPGYCEADDRSLVEFNPESRRALLGTNVLVFGDREDERNLLEGFLVNLGYTVDNELLLPTDLTPFRTIWHVGAFVPITAMERSRLHNFVTNGGGLHLTGERPCCENINESIEALINGLLSGTSTVTVGEQGDVGDPDAADMFNPTAADGISTTPNTLTSWESRAPGGILGVSGENVLAVPECCPQAPAVGAVWRCDDLIAGNGRITLLMDVNWLHFDTTPLQEVENIQSFLETDCIADTAPPTGAEGDPHFNAWKGKTYDYHGACDLVLASNPHFEDETGLNIHVRTKIKDNWSYISSAAVRIGDDTLEIFGDKDEKKYFFNGKKSAAFPLSLGKHEVTFERPDRLSRLYTIQLSAEESISIRTWRFFVAVNFNNATEATFGQSVGMLGNFHTGQVFARDGKRILEAPNQRGTEWQVGVGKNDPSLFQEAFGPQYPTKCELPPPESVKQRRRRLSEASITEEEAEAKCAHVPAASREHCVFDILATGDIGMAGAY